MFARRSSRRSLAVLIAFVVAIAGLVSTASPASAATCERGSDDVSVAVFLGEDPAVPNTISLQGGEIVVDGTNCGVPGSVVVMDFTATAAANKQIVFDATESWEGIFVVMLLESVPEEGTGDLIFAVDAEYDLTVTTSAASETVRYTDVADGGIIQVLRGDVPHLQLGVLNDPIDLTMRLGSGDDEFNLANSFDNDLIVGLTVLGNAGDDMIYGTSLDDDLRGGAGNDDIRGRAGDDSLRGNGGADNMRGGPGDDDIRGGLGNDVARGNAGADELRGQGGDDELRGGGGGDFLNGGRGVDLLIGNAGNDRFKSNGDGSIDTVSGGLGSDDTCDRCDAIDQVRNNVENQ